MMLEPIWWDWAIFDGNGLCGINENAPEEIKKEYEKYQANNVITITRVESPYYQNGTFSWEYKPSRTSKLCGSSASNEFFFVVMDDNLNLYNTSFLRTDHSEYDFK